MLHLENFSPERWMRKLLWSEIPSAWSWNLELLWVEIPLDIEKI